MNTAVALTPAQAAAQQEERAQRALKFVQTFEVASDEDYTMAAEELSSLKARTDAVEEERKKITVPMNTALQAANDLFRGPRALLESASGILKAKMLVYRQKQAAIAEGKRALAEQEAAAERKRLAEEAAAHAAQGRQDDAQAAFALAEVTVAQPVVAAAPRAAGTSVAKTLAFEVTNKAELCQYLIGQFATRPDLLDYVNVDTVKLRAAVKAHGKALGWPGVRVFEQETMRVR